MNYEKIRTKLLEIQEMMSEIPQDCKGNSEDAHVNRHKYMKIKTKINDILDIL